MNLGITNHGMGTVIVRTDNKFMLFKLKRTTKLYGNNDVLTVPRE